MHSWDEAYNKQLPSLKALWVKRIPVHSTGRALHFPSRVETLRFFVDDAPDWHPPRNLPKAMTHPSWCPNMRIILLTRFESRFDIYGQPSPDLSRAIEPLRMAYLRKGIRLCWKIDTTNVLLDVSPLVKTPSMLYVPSTPTEATMTIASGWSLLHDTIVPVGVGRPDRYIDESITYTRTSLPSATCKNRFPDFGDTDWAHGRITYRRKRKLLPPEASSFNGGPVYGAHQS